MTLDGISIDIDAARSKTKSVPEQVANVAPGDLRGLTEEIYDRLDAATEGAEDVAFIATDPAEDDAPGWNLAHAIVHLTAGLEENAAQASTLARGAEITGRPRYETPWEEITTVDQVRQRLQESRRITPAFLDTWPDAPHTAATHEHEFFGTMNAVADHVVGLNHARGHLAQIAEIRRQESRRAG